MGCNWVKELLAGCLLMAFLSITMSGCTRQHSEITKLDEASQATIGVMTGSIGESLVGERFPKADIKSFDDVMDAVSAMLAGQLDATVTSYPAALQVCKKYKILQLLDEPLDKEQNAIAARKEDGDLLAEVNAILVELDSAGIFADLRRRWFKSDLLPYEELSIDLPKQGTPLRIGVSATREPFSFIDGKNNVSGHDGDLARLICSRMNRPVEFHDMKFMALIPALQSGKIDLIITGMVATEERAKSVAFSIPYYDNKQVMIVRNNLGVGPVNQKPRLADVNDLRNKRVGVLLGSTHEAWVLKNLPDATVLQYRSVPDVAVAIKTNKVDAGLFDSGPLNELMREDETLGKLGDPLFAFDCGIGFAKESTSLRDEFNRFLEELRANGTYEDMVLQWMNGGPTQSHIIENRAHQGELVVGICSVGLPFVAVQDNQLVGFEVELANRFAAWLGRDLKLMDMEFSSLIAAVSSGKVDMISGTIFITPERQERVNFSAPYYRMDVLAAAPKAKIAAFANTVPTEILQTTFWHRLSESFYSNLIMERRYLLILNGLQTTIVISLLSALAGTMLGAVVCFGRMSKRVWLRWPAIFYISVLRGTPVLVVLMLIYYVVFASIDISPVLAAVVAFALNFAAYSAEIFRTGILGVDRGQTEAGLSLGFSRQATFRHIVLPQTILRILPVYKGEFISLVKMTSIVGYIAVQDLTKASDIIRSRTFDAFFPLLLVALLYFLISWIFIWGIDRVESALKSSPACH